MGVRKRAQGKDRRQGQIMEGNAERIKPRRKKPGEREKKVGEK